VRKGGSTQSLRKGHRLTISASNQPTDITLFSATFKRSACAFVAEIHKPLSGVWPTMEMDCPCIAFLRSTLEIWLLAWRFPKSCRCPPWLIVSCNLISIPVFDLHGNHTVTEELRRVAISYSSLPLQKRTSFLTSGAQTDQRKTRRHHGRPNRVPDRS
jgi:hypothetical protein